MRGLVFNKKFYKALFLILVLTYACCNFINQQKTLNSYDNQILSYEEKIIAQKEYKEELNSIKNDAASVEYIEEIAREKLDMYLPNERVYIDKEK